MDPTSPEAGGSPRVDHREPAPPQYSEHGPESPLSGVERGLGRPLSVGLALLLVVGNVLGWAWFVQRQDERFDQLESQMSSVDTGPPPPAADPALFWLLGASVRSSGRGSELAGQISQSGVLDDCSESAIRGANGYGP